MYAWPRPSTATPLTEETALAGGTAPVPSPLVSSPLASRPNTRLVPAVLILTMKPSVPPAPGVGTPEIAVAVGASKLPPANPTVLPPTQAFVLDPLAQVPTAAVPGAQSTPMPLPLSATRFC